jgi:hypothetical protein
MLCASKKLEGIVWWVVYVWKRGTSYPLKQTWCVCVCVCVFVTDIHRLRLGQLLQGAGRGATTFYTSSVDAWCSLGPNGALSGPDEGAHATMGGPNRPGQRAQDLQGRLRPPIRLYICTMGRHTISSLDYWAWPTSDTSHTIASIIPWVFLHLPPQPAVTFTVQCSHACTCKLTQALRLHNNKPHACCALHTAYQTCAAHSTQFAIIVLLNAIVYGCSHA